MKDAAMARQQGEALTDAALGGGIAAALGSAGTAAALFTFGDLYRSGGYYPQPKSKLELAKDFLKERARHHPEWVVKRRA